MFLWTALPAGQLSFSRKQLTETAHIPSMQEMGMQTNAVLSKFT